MTSPRYELGLECRQRLDAEADERCRRLALRGRAEALRMHAERWHGIANSGVAGLWLAARIDGAQLSVDGALPTLRELRAMADAALDLAEDVEADREWFAANGNRIHPAP